MVQFAPFYQVQLNDISVDLRVQFDDAEKYNLPGPGAAFQSVTYKMKVVSSSANEDIQKLITHAERGCHTAQSLRMPIPVTVEADIVSPQKEE